MKITKAFPKNIPSRRTKLPHLSMAEYFGQMRLTRSYINMAESMETDSLRTLSSGITISSTALGTFRMLVWQIQIEHLGVCDSILIACGMAKGCRRWNGQSRQRKRILLRRLANWRIRAWVYFAYGSQQHACFWHDWEHISKWDRPGYCPTCRRIYGVFACGRWWPSYILWRSSVTL